MKRFITTYLLAGAAMVCTAGVASASSVVSGSVYCDLTNAYAINTPTLAQLASAESTSAGQCATFTANAINFASGPDGSPGNNGSLNAFLNYKAGNLISSTYFALPAANVGAGGVATTNTGGQSQDGSLLILTGTTYLTTGESITLSHDDGALLYFNGVLISDPNGSNQTVDGQAPFIYTGATGSGSYELIYSSNYLPPGELQSSVNVTPEPSSLVLLGTGLMSAAGATLRRRRTVA